MNINDSKTQVYAATSKMTKKVFALENDRFVFENLNLIFFFFDSATFLEGSSLLCVEGNEMR